MQAITLLGDQVAPILMFASLLPSSGTLHILTTTAKQGRAQHLTAALAMLSPGLKVSTHILKNHYDMRSLSAMARKLIAGNGETLVDLTGGTKLMSLALYQAVQQTSAKAIYIDSETGVIRDVTDASGHIVSERLPHIPSNVVFRAYGKAACDDRRWLPEGLPLLIDYIDNYFQAWCDFFTWFNTSEFKHKYTAAPTGEIHFQKDLATPHNSHGNLWPAISTVLSYLKALGWLDYRRVGQTVSIRMQSDALLKFLQHGSWLEEYIYPKISGRFQEVRKNVALYDYDVYAEIAAQGGDIGHVKANEVDVLINEYGKMLFLECKAGYSKSLFSNTAEQIPKLESVAHKTAGYFARIAIVTHRRQDEIPPIFRQRLQNARIELICREDLKDLAWRVACML
ncbi:hypothetical protein TcarDRAFT_2596 [Thermosinus carboxydivorans Nor1]|uniref:DUF1887 domain-containing protein n=1 Tax=Thermosinus carboxydivorans Nor1 TaxID=401526 RepID=A1HM58_9FIRM|nr:DUF1887 family CARF protein [Thermosinus carboxydivorans]EAX48907.1 hypothetical protein TcarDRAFT_2596 [Thermosinus carboxydivorans Nor1]